jgi:hypothetical protein
MIDIDAALDLITKMAAAVHQGEVDGPWVKLEQTDDDSPTWHLNVVDQNDDPIFEQEGSAYLTITVQMALEKLTTLLRKKNQGVSELIAGADLVLGGGKS